jgi:hydrogenase expression/formation protein HypC
MCIGLPLQVQHMELDGLSAWCEADGQREQLDMRLVGPQPAGTWVLAFMGAARQVMSPLEAEQARGARQALAAVMRGESVDAFFADLVNREPELPAHLRAMARPATPTETA